MWPKTNCKSFDTDHGSGCTHEENTDGWCLDKHCPLFTEEHTCIKEMENQLNALGRQITKIIG